MLKKSSKIVVWIDDTFDHNIWIENDITKYLKESCWQWSNQNFSIKYFSNCALA